MAEKIAIKFTPVNVTERQDLEIGAGDTIRVWSKIQEKGKTRLQAFEGMVLARKHGNEPGAMITVRKVTNGVGVERIFPLYSPLIDKIEVVKKSKVRKSKLYYIRDKAAKEIRKKMKTYVKRGLAKLSNSDQPTEPEESAEPTESTEPEMKNTETSE